MTPLGPQDLELAALRKELEKLNLEKQILQARYDTLSMEVSIERKNAETSLSVSQLKMDWLASAKELESLKGSDPALRDALCIDFANRLRVGALKDIENDPDNIIVLKVTAYEVYYRACVATLENRNLRVKLAARDRFAEDVKKNREAGNAERRAKEQKKIESATRNDPMEKMIQGLMAFGLTREAAIAQVSALNSAAKELTK